MQYPNILMGRENPNGWKLDLFLRNFNRKFCVNLN